jgi:AcrR family transcriptional regulator
MARRSADLSQCWCREPQSPPLCNLERSRLRLTSSSHLCQDVFVTTSGRTYGGRSAEQPSRERRERFVKAVRELITEEGLAPLTVDMICQRANVSKPYFYDEFSSKEDVFDVCADDLYSRLWTGMQTALAEVPRPHRVRAALQSIIHALASNPADARLYMESPGFPRLLERQRRAVEEFSNHITKEAMPFAGRAKKSINRQLGTRALVAGAADLIIAWLHGDIDTNEESLIATLTAATLGAAERL